MLIFEFTTCQHASSLYQCYRVHALQLRPIDACELQSSFAECITYICRSIFVADWVANLWRKEKRGIWFSAKFPLELVELAKAEAGVLLFQRD